MAVYARDRRSGKDRRAVKDRRQFADPNYGGPERRKGKDRRKPAGRIAEKYDYLLRKDLVSEQELNRAVLDAQRRGIEVEQVLLQDYKISKQDVGTALSRFYQCRYIAFDDNIAIPGELLRNLKPSFLWNNLWVPIEQKDGRITVLMDEPNHLIKRDMVRNLLKSSDLEFCVGLKEDILRFLDYFIGTPQQQDSVDEIVSRMEVEDELDTDDDLLSETHNVIVQFVNKMITDASFKRASDIHIESNPGRQNMEIRFRIDGNCIRYQTVPYQYSRAVVSRVKIMAELNITERRLPQDGKIRFKKFGGNDMELRVATLPMATGVEDVNLRILATGGPIPIKKLGFSQDNLKVFKGLIEMPYGIVLVVGPTGSGKTTTLHAALAEINRPQSKILTAEDPVEITQMGLRQLQVQPKIGLTFATAMRAFLRHDPDVIMVGEMRDEETAQIGIEASLTGHLVLSTLHTNSAPETVTRLLDMGIDSFNFADALLGIVAQRLVRTLCKGCKQAYHPTEEQFHSLVTDYGEADFHRLNLSYSPDLTLYQKRGCETCSETGYYGRTAIHELMVGTDQIKRLIQRRRPTEEIRTQAKKNKMVSLKQDGIKKVIQGLTDIAEVRKVCIR